MRTFPRNLKTKQYRNTARLTRYVTFHLVVLFVSANPPQRAGEYVLSWADELEKQYAAPAAQGPKSTLVKRSAKDRAADADEASSHPSKRIKAESGPDGVDVEVRLHYEKGSLSKVRSLARRLPEGC